MSNESNPIDQDSKLVASVAAEHLGIKAVTLRKYSTLVEKQLNDERRFRTGTNSHRLYTAADLAAFQQAIALTEAGTTLADALNQTFTAAPTPKATPTAKSAPKTALAPAPQAAVNPAYAELSQQNHELMKQNEELAKQQQVMTRRLDSLNYRLNLVLDKLDQQPKKTTPWWLGWLK
ncbi:MerR family transcriptional regulator [Lactiplantibacillus fabifermentans]|uniref:HTH merR-type domain-containing protein n=2 Tax=Lactiplantibacillus fabifermentans TaxID=483011 RepID=A0A0R2NKY9_9LACO|nr:MerR family transcriptional regulator [Lactiplantibacillus fabifermentans]ETY75576.1 hypothetical protein LFAB_01170 [Lactiplantibacillus fabifermentans T30PCM01]KRO26408.1 hypothetical protein DY78_GL001011 [Lactiplantibacillus fabifermentans DSM 21115]